MLHNPRPTVSIRCEIGDGNPKPEITSDMAHNVVAASFFPAQVSSIQLARDIEFSIFAEAERLV